MRQNKTDYSLSHKKKIVQGIVFNDLKKKKIQRLVGLAGPNISDYVSFFKNKNIKKIEVYENNFNNLILQIKDFTPVIKTTVNYCDIYKAELQPNTVYDLDFCCTIRKAAMHLKKFTENIIVTLSLRGIGISQTLKLFAKNLSDAIPLIQYDVDVNSIYRKHLLTIEDKSYTCYEYCDTSPMVVIKSNF